MASEILGIRVPQVKKKQLEAVCEQLDTVPSVVVRQLIDVYLKQAPSLIKQHRKEKAQLEEVVGELEKQFYLENPSEDPENY
jgi:hypothetical protein